MIEQEKLIVICPRATFEENSQWPTMLINNTDWRALAEQLKNNSEFNFDYLFCVTALDAKTHLTMIYHLESTTSRNILVVKAKIENRMNAEIPTVCDLWRTAEFHEREAFDLMGVTFLNHPDLRRLFLTDDWVGFPLRKDYDDPINMIKL